MKRLIALLTLFVATPALALPPQVALPAYVPPPTSVASRVPGAADDYKAGYFPPNAISSLYVSNVGAGCTGTPTLAIGAPGTGGVQATGHLVMASGGATVLGAVIDNPGANYTSNPTATLSGGGCTTAPTVAAYYNPTGALWNSPAGVYQMQQGAAGAAVWSRYTTAGLPLDLVANPVSAAAVSAGGTGYAVGNTITLANGTVLTVATISSGAVATVTVTTGGSWPCGIQAGAQAQASTNASGAGATFTLTIAGANVAYGTKLLTACYTTNKVMDIKRASDNTTLTIGFVNRVMDASTARQFCQNTICYVTKWYDQSGYGNDGTQTSTNAVLDFNWIIGGLPGIYLAGQFTIPTTASFTNPGVSGIWAGLDMSYKSGAYTFSIGSNTAILTSSPAPQFNFNVGSQLVATPFLTSSGTPEVTGFVSASTSSATIFINDNEQTCTTTNGCGGSTTTTGGYLQNGGSAVATAFIAATRAYTATERTAVRAALYTMFAMTPQVRDIVLTSGDSRTTGVNATDNYNYPEQMAPLLAVPAHIYNTGVSGDTIALRLSRFYTEDVQPILQPHGKNAWIILWIGYNDLTGSNLSPATVYTGITTYISQAHALGWKVALSTETEGTGTGGNFTQLNTLIAANAARADAIIPQMAADPVWVSPVYTPCALGFATLPHPTSCGYAFVAQDVAAGFNPLLH